jgi:hypothetical protein
MYCTELHVVLGPLGGRCYRSQMGVIGILLSLQGNPEIGGLASLITKLCGTLRLVTRDVQIGVAVIRSPSPSGGVEVNIEPYQPMPLGLRGTHVMSRKLSLSHWLFRLTLRQVRGERTEYEPCNIEAFRLTN